MLVRRASEVPIVLSPELSSAPVLSHNRARGILNKLDNPQSIMAVDCIDAILLIGPDTKGVARILDVTMANVMESQQSRRLSPQGPDGLKPC